ncbi:uncharacterized protein GGS22DRAFT_152988 [Annulohypoxylon maeteangense]|uniref:uncharacterized protein n=1 Tax=Annulohypoxylon maeteangense TaxID=1927788 RepID=UPI002007BC81|nr:uncharacterized protein GGS22DRAFT_152988 [Annulohypoxylon maeteangense]KAI0889043.1 hypothetical protein GGS22DRAFT_152988 [Annulohypoxylon maeteangense]
MANDERPRPQILLISLNLQPYFDEIYRSLLTELGTKGKLHRVKKADTAIRLLSENPRPSAVLITDEALTDQKNAHVWEAVLQYVRQGGTAVAMGQFSSFVKPNKMKPFFSKAGLPWESGSYHRTTLVLNQEVVGDVLAAKLVSRYSQKALFVKPVAFEDAWYQTNENSVHESHVFAPTSVNNEGETAVALARVGEGKLGYLGDVNAEKGSEAVILAMCGL